VTFGATFATGAGTATVSTLDQLNSVLASNGITALASVSSTADTLTFTSTNDAASQTITTGGTAPVGAGVDIKGTTTATAGTVNAAVADVVSQATRANLVTQYNQIVTQIGTTAQDASFNGINLLNGDSLKLVFDETVLAKLNTASVTLRSQASAFGANLSIVQIRQDFNKNLINVLQTGSSALTLADTNEEAANSQALSTRQSIATSALSLANQSQQSVLQLLR